MIHVTTYGDIYVLNIGFIYVCSVWADRHDNPNPKPYLVAVQYGGLGSS